MNFSDLKRAVVVFAMQMLCIGGCFKLEKTKPYSISTLLAYCAVFLPVIGYVIALYSARVFKKMSALPGMICLTFTSIAAMFAGWYIASVPLIALFPHDR